jgi:hypothetical protein
MNKIRSLSVLIFLAAAGMAAPLQAAGPDLIDHGVCAPVSLARGIAAATGTDGQDILIMQLIDHRGAYGILKLDFATGKSEFTEQPFAPDFLKAVFAAMSSRANRFYAHHADHFTEYDPATGHYTFAGKTHPGMSMSMTEDDRGVIWSVSYPDCGLVSYDPATKKLTDYGIIKKENWPQYARMVAADDRGWIYFGYGNTHGQIVGFDPRTRQTVQLFADGECPPHTAGLVFRAENGKVYGVFGPSPQYADTLEAWNKLSEKVKSRCYELHDGKMTPLAGSPPAAIVKITAGTQEFRHLEFASGRRIVECDIPGRRIVSAAAPGEPERTFKLEYPSEGAHQISIIATADGKITGGTAFPMSNFVYDPAAGTMLHRNGAVQWNTVIRHGAHLFVGAYNGGYLLDWDLEKPYAMPEKVADAVGNPRLVAPPARPHIGRPNVLEITPDGHYVLMGGTPDYGYTGGGLAIYDRETGKMEVIAHTGLIPDQAIHTLVALPDGRIFGGTTINAGTGGEVRATNAVFFEFELAGRKIIWRKELYAKVRTYTDLALTPDGRILGVTDSKRLFVFDPQTREVVAENETGPYGPAVYQQGPRMLLRDGDALLLLCPRHVLRVNPSDASLTPLVESPVKIEVGGDIVGDRLYFGSKAHLYSLKLR